jgi:hypothetical protein
MARLGVVTALVVAGIMASGAAPAATHLTAVLDSAPSASAAQRRWGRELLREDHLPTTRCNRNAMAAWAAAEGGNWGNGAAHNPLNTTKTEPGSWPMPGSTNIPPVQAYPTWRAGMRATIATLSHYSGVLAALRAGNNAQAVANAVAASPWGTGPFQASC